MAPQPPGLLSPSQEGADPWIRGGPQAPLSPPLPMAEQPPRGAVLTEGILGATVVGRILGGPAPSSFGTCDNRTRGSLGAPTPVPGVQPPPHPSRCPPRGLPVLSPSPPSPAALTSESVWAPAGGSVLGPRVCTRFASWIEKEGTVPGGLCPPPHGMPRRAPALVLTWYRGVEAEGSSPAKSDSESSSCSMTGTDYGGTTSLLPQEPNPAWSCLPGLEPAPPSLPTPLSAPYQEPAPAPGGAQEGAAPFSHVDQAPLGDGAARLQHQLLGPEDPRLALRRDREFRGRAATPGATPTPWAQPGTHPEVSTGLRRLRPRGVSVWRSRGGFGVTKHPGTTGTWCRWGWGCRDTPTALGVPYGECTQAGTRGVPKSVPKGAGAHPKHLKKSLTCCPGCVSRCLRVQTGTLLLLGDTGAWHGGDSAPGGDGDSDATLTGSLQGGWARMGYTLWKQRKG